MWWGGPPPKVVYLEGKEEEEVAFVKCNSKEKEVEDKMRIDARKI